MGSLLARVGLWERRRGVRVSMRGWMCCTSRGSEQKWVGIGDISPTGIYLITDDRWPLGTSIQIVLQGRLLPHGDSRPEVRLWARCVRQGEDGAGLVFAHEYADRAAWLNLMAQAAALPGQNDVVRLFCTTKALAFLLSVCPAAKDQVVKFFPTVLSPGRIESAIAIALRAEQMHASQNGSAATSLCPSLVLRILEEGSKVRDGLMQQCWAGLLITCSPADLRVKGRPCFLTLLSALDQVQIRILDAAWTRATQAGWEPGFVFSKSLLCAANEIKEISGERDLVNIERYLNNLHHLGLLEYTEKVSPIGQIEYANLTPTALGLRFYARCAGQAEVPEMLAGADEKPAAL